MKKLEEADWTALQKHVHDRNYAAPTPFLYLVAAAIGDATQIEAGICHADMSGDTSRWTAWVVTPTTLGLIDVTYEASIFDMTSSEERLLKTNPPGRTVHAATVIRLSDIRSIEISGAYERGDGFRSWIAVEGMKLHTQAPDPIELPSQERIYSRDEADYSNLFYETIRQGAQI